MIKRYRPELIDGYDRPFIPDMESDVEGQYVEYSDHVEVVKDLLEDLWYLARTLKYKDDPVSLHHSKQYQDKYMNLIKEYGL